MTFREKLLGRRAILKYDFLQGSAPSGARDQRHLQHLLFFGDLFEGGCSKIVTISRCLWPIDSLPVANLSQFEWLLSGRSFPKLEKIIPAKLAVSAIGISTSALEMHFVMYNSCQWAIAHFSFVFLVLHTASRQIRDPRYAKALFS